MTRFLAFAYGSNLSSARLRERTPSARFVARARLAEHSLRWHKRGMDGSAKCDAAFTNTASDEIWGVVYEIRRVHKPRLDQAEGLGSGYLEKQVLVEADRGPLRAQMYYAIDIDARLEPYHWYKQYVLHGAREHDLPGEYIQRLEQVPSRADPDLERAAAHAAAMTQGARWNEPS